MSKRDKTPDITSLLGGKVKPEAPAPEPESKQDLHSKQELQSKQSKHELPTVQRGLPTGWTRATFIVREDSLEQLKALAYYQRRPLKEVIEEALARYLRGEKTGEALEVYRKQN